MEHVSFQMNLCLFSVAIYVRRTFHMAKVFVRRCIVPCAFVSVTIGQPKSNVIHSQDTLAHVSRKFVINTNLLSFYSIHNACINFFCVVVNKAQKNVLAKIN